jgi:tetratricopeptide (TPR) repeat protein
LTSKGEHDLALADYDKALAMTPEHADSYAGRGRTYVRKGEYKRGIEDLDAALKIAPRDPRTYEERGYAYRLLKDYDRAIADYTQAAAFDPTSGAPLEMRCWTRGIANRDLIGARADCEEAERLGVSKTVVRESLCFVRYRLGEYDKGLADCDVALAGNPKLAYALYVRGLAKRRTGQPASGDTDIAAAKALEATVVEDFAGYGVVD